ncbi:thioredoxin family protein [Lichenicoccus sp.]|uniref:thioredoxin family protein n=1 Tax=Lichenicoccus sp. TaxID=2781899 RepID=UPI003D12997C
MKPASRFAAAIVALSLIGPSLAWTSGPVLALTPPPQVPPGQPQPVAHPYDTPAAAHDAVAAAVRQARQSGRRLLIDFGANWCPDCRMLAGVMRLAPVQPWVAQNFVPVSVNVDHFNVNMDIARRYGVVVKAIPTVLIVTPDGKLLNADGTLTLGNARTMSSQAVVDQLAKWNARS